MRILLFDMWAGGHNARYFDRFSAALADHDVTVAAPAGVCDGMAARSVTFLPLPHARSAPVFGRPEESWDDSIRREVELIGELAASTRADLVVHLFADHLVHRGADLAAAAPTAMLVLFPAEHYPHRYGAELTAEERGRAAALSAHAAVFRAAGGTVLTLDADAAASWSDGPGRPAFWLPEPWIDDAGPTGDSGRDGVLFYGAMAHRKGFDLLTDAMLRQDPGIRLVVAGWIEQAGYDGELAGHADRLRAAGVTVDLRLRHHDEAASLALQRAAEVTVLPYRRHFGMSRVFLEAVHCGTPVVVNDFGLLAHLVSSRGLGVVTTVTDPAALSAAITKARDMRADAAFHDACAQFAAEFRRDRFVTRLREALGV